MNAIAIADPHVDRAAWLEARKAGIGSSDAAAVCGQSPWSTALEVYLHKTGAVSAPEENVRMRWGTLLEPVLASAYEDVTDTPLRKVPMLQHPRLAWMLASIDRVTIDGSRIVEFKNVGQNLAHHWLDADEGPDGIPPYVHLQVQHQMEVSGIHETDVVALIGGHDFRIYSVPFNAAMAESIIGIESAFWKCVEQGTPPHPDWSHPATPDLIAAMHRPRGDVSVTLGILEQQQVEMYQWACEQIRQAEQMKDEAKARLIDYMGSAGRAEFPSGVVVTRKRVQRKAYSVEATDYYDFRVKAPRDK